MKTYVKRSICFLLAAIMTLSLSACTTGVKMTEENITKAIQKVEKALREFDTETLEQYVSSKTLNYIINYAGAHEQMQHVGKLMFEQVEIKPVSFDLDNATVTVAVKNRDLARTGTNYCRMLKARSKNDKMEMLNLMGSEDFLDISEKALTAQISRAIVPDNPTEVTLTIKQSKKNLVLVFNEEAENAVSGGAVKAVKSELFGESTTPSVQN